MCVGKEGNKWIKNNTTDRRCSNKYIYSNNDLSDSRAHHTPSHSPCGTLPCLAPLMSNSHPIRTRSPGKTAHPRTSPAALCFLCPKTWRGCFRSTGCHRARGTAVSEYNTASSEESDTRFAHSSPPLTRMIPSITRWLTRGYIRVPLKYHACSRMLVWDPHNSLNVLADLHFHAKKGPMSVSRHMYTYDWYTTRHVPIIFVVIHAP